MQKNCALQAAGIKKSYGKKTALKKTFFCLKKKKVYGLLGPNGAGKTTLLKILAGILEPDFGDVKIEGVSVKENEKNAKQKIAFLPEENYLFDELNPLEHFCFIKGFYNSSEKAFSNCMNLLGISEAMEKRTEELSKGQKRKAAICLVFSQNASIFLLDELTSGLDPISKKKVLLLLKKEKLRENTVLFSTHVLDEAAKLCDSFIFMQDGSVKEYESLEAALKDTNTKSIDAAFLKLNKKGE